MEGGVVAPRLKRAAKFSMSVHVLKNVKKTNPPHAHKGSLGQNGKARS